MMDLWLFSETKLRTKIDTIFGVKDESGAKYFIPFISKRIPTYLRE